MKLIPFVLLLLLSQGCPSGDAAGGFAAGVGPGGVGDAGGRNNGPGDDAQDGPGEPACARGADCLNDGQVCVVERDNGPSPTRCGAPVGGLEGAQPCGRDDECQTNLCEEGLCSAACLEDADCPEGLDCAEARLSDVVSLTVCLEPLPCQRDADCEQPDACVGRRFDERIDWECAEVNIDGGGPDDDCDDDLACERNLCADGDCIVPCLEDGDCGQAQVCRPMLVELELAQVEVLVCQEPEPCAAPDECGDASRTCVFDYGSQEVETLCLTPIEGGEELDSTCTQNLGCANNLCLSDFLETVCSHPCLDDADCLVEGYTCQARVVRASPESIRSVCVPPEPEACASSAGCDEAEVCSVVSDREGEALVSLCVDPLGESDAGARCDADSDCDTGLCLEGLCSALCLGDGDCGAQQICVADHLLTRDGLSAAFALCLPLPEVACGHSPECSLGGRVCGDVRFDDPAQAYCIEPMPGGDPVTTACEGSFSPNDQCEDRICLVNYSDECTTTCLDDADCAPFPGTYGCSDFRLRGDTVRLCAQTCLNDSECDRDEDHHCGLIRNETDDRFEFVCRRPAGQDLPGSDCSQEVNCDHGICLINRENNEVVERVCTLPCQTDSDCPETLPVCSEATISRPRTQQSQALRICNRD